MGVLFACERPKERCINACSKNLNQLLGKRKLEMSLFSVSSPAEKAPTKDRPPKKMGGAGKLGEVH